MKYEPKKFCTKCGKELQQEGDWGYCDNCKLKFNLLQKSPIYDMDTLNGINSIPVPAINYNTGEWTKDYIYYVLQRKATEHKRNHRLDLAIACLRKSNALSDYEDRPPLLEKDYLRLVKYLRLNGENDAADEEESQIYARHPEFKDKRILNLPRIAETLAECNCYNIDLVIIYTNTHCPFCSKYNSRIFSISGKSKRFPKLPDVIEQQGGGCPNCSLCINICFDDILSFNHRKFCTKCGRLLRRDGDWAYCNNCMLKFNIPQNTTLTEPAPPVPITTFVQQNS